MPSPVRARYQIGDRPSFDGPFLDADGVATAPSAVTVKTRKPDGTVSTYTTPDASIVLGTTTRFTMPAPLDTAGIWTINMTGTAGVQAADEIEFEVDRSKFA